MLPTLIAMTGYFCNKLDTLSRNSVDKTVKAGHPQKKWVVVSTSNLQSWQNGFSVKLYLNKWVLRGLRPRVTWIRNLPSLPWNWLWNKRVEHGLGAHKKCNFNCDLKWLILLLCFIISGSVFHALTVFGKKNFERGDLTRTRFGKFGNKLYTRELAL